MHLVERLGFKTLHQLYQEMSNNDICEWMAFDLLRNPESRERLEKELKTVSFAQADADEQSEAIRELLNSLGTS